MKTYDWHSLDAFKTTLKFMNDNRSYWSDNEHVVESVDYVSPLVQELLRRGDKQQGTQPEGHTDAKDAALGIMLGLGWKECKKLKVFARKTGKLVLLQEVSFSKTSFEYGTEEEQAARCRIVAERAEVHLPALASYKITRDGIDKLKASIDAFAPLETERDSVMDKRKLLTASIETLMRQARIKFKELDGEIDAFFDEEEQEEFYNGYFEARRVSRLKARQPEKRAE
ncbi:MAG: hypothetical protein EOO15_23575 [Chitinophagaceae bacterium]|nr:MAG: hypothetical protein EOO15_23575 [Chitinophagaceae bacterium]